MKALTKQQAKTISSLFNSITVWNIAIDRTDSNHEDVIKFMRWHDEVADELAELGISVSRYNCTL
jgi:hypothetical protein